MMFKISRFPCLRKILRPIARHCARNSQNLPKAKILSSSGEDFFKISFKYGNIPNSGNILHFKVEKDQMLSQVIQRIKLMVNLQKKKEEIRRSVMNKYSSSPEVVDMSDEEDDVDVALMKGDIVLDNDMKNADAWTNGALLKVGDTFFEIHRNAPTVLRLYLPEFIIMGCTLRPHFILESSVLEDCDFDWYRGTSETVHEDNDQDWVKISQGLMYQTTSDDVGRQLKLVCTPKHGESIGVPFSTVSLNAVEAGPDMFPFEERHQYTRDLADSDCVRCISYNILANVYMEIRRFPYCTKKARDIYYRKQLLIKEIIGFNSDIICLQEVQERVFSIDLLSTLKSANLEGIYDKKSGRRHEGLAFFYRTTKFKVLNRETVYLNEVVKDKAIFNDLLTKVSGNYKDMSKLLAQDTVLQLVLLQHLDQPKKRILVANTHLYSNKDKPEVRLIQAALCTSYTEHILKSQENDVTTAVVFCGDFNSLPESAAFEYITKGSSKCCASLKSNSTVKNLDTTLRHSLKLDTACGIPRYTNFTEDFNGCLDYIFYSVNDFDVSEIVPMPSHDSVTEHVALPSELFPSDHIPLVCTLKWKTWNDTG